MWRRRSEEHTSELQSRLHLVCRLLLEKKREYVSARLRALGRGEGVRGTLDANALGVEDAAEECAQRVRVVSRRSPHHVSRSTRSPLRRQFSSLERRTHLAVA